MLMNFSISIGNFYIHIGLLIMVAAAVAFLLTLGIQIAVTRKLNKAIAEKKGTYRLGAATTGALSAPVAGEVSAASPVTAELFTPPADPESTMLLDPEGTVLLDETMSHTS